MFGFPSRETGLGAYTTADPRLARRGSIQEYNIWAASPNSNEAQFLDIHEDVAGIASRPPYSAGPSAVPTFPPDEFVGHPSGNVNGNFDFGLGRSLGWPSQYDYVRHRLADFASAMADQARVAPAASRFSSQFGQFGFGQSELGHNSNGLNLARRYSHGDMYGFKSFLPYTLGLSSQPAPVAAQQNTPPEHPKDSEKEAILDYFRCDPQLRVQVTAAFLAERYLMEEQCLSDVLQLPHFPSEVSLRRSQLVLVAFKAGRIDVFSCPDDNPALEYVKIGDLVIVEADRGKDLGMVVRIGVSVDEARLLKLLHFLEQQAAFAGANVSDMLLQSIHLETYNQPSPSTLHAPKPILALALSHEISLILQKAQDEEKACRMCNTKITSATNSASGKASEDLKQMRLVDAEYQFDRRKLIFYYSTTRRIDFRDLVRELFRMFKTRIWMCAVTGLPYEPRRNSAGAQSSLKTIGEQHAKKPAAHRRNSLSMAGGLVYGSSERANDDVPRNFASASNSRLRESGESLVLQSLVDNINI